MYSREIEYSALNLKYPELVPSALNTKQKPLGPFTQLLQEAGDTSCGLYYHRNQKQQRSRTFPTPQGGRLSLEIMSNGLSEMLC